MTGTPRRSEPGFTDEDYRSILTFRTRLRRFLAWSGAQARAAGLTPTQHQLLLAVRGHPDPRGPTISDIADYLQLRHHSAVGLVDRAEAAGLVRRRDDAHDRRLARVQLEPEGEAALEHLTAMHVAELRALTDGLSLPEMPGSPEMPGRPEMPGSPEMPGRPEMPGEPAGGRGQARPTAGRRGEREAASPGRNPRRSGGAAR